MHPYTADLRAANRAGPAPASLQWALEYSFKSQFDMPARDLAFEHFRGSGGAQEGRW